MEENNTPTPRPGVAPVNPVRRPMDDFSATPRPVSIPVSSPPKPDVATSTGSAPTFTSTSSLDTPAATESVPTPIVIGNASAAKVEEKGTDPSELIPGLNTKPDTDSFKDTPVSLTDTSEDKAPVVAETKPDVEQKPTAGVVTSPQYKQPSKKGKGVAILVAVILAIGLIAGAGYAYLQNTKEVAPPVDTKPTVTTPAKDPATADDIDTLNTDINNTMTKVDDTKDYQANDLSDTTLGLQ